MNWKTYFKKDKEVVLITTTPTGAPNASIVASLGFVDGKILFANCHLFTTIKNIEKNKKVCLVGGYFRVKGKAKIFSAGKYFERCVKENRGYPVCVSSAILIDTREVFDLDKVKPVKI